MDTEQRRQPRPQEIYRHFKGNLYQILTLARMEDTGEMLVVYQALYGEYGIWARKLSVFMEEVDRKKYPEASQRYRFELLQREENVQKKQSGIEKRPGIPEGSENRKEEGIEPFLEKFLDAEAVEEKIEILNRNRENITEDILDVMALSLDVEIPQGELSGRLDHLQDFLQTRNRYEQNRSFR